MIEEGQYCPICNDYYFYTHEGRERCAETTKGRRVSDENIVPFPQPQIETLPQGETQVTETPTGSVTAPADMSIEDQIKALEDKIDQLEARVSMLSADIRQHRARRSSLLLVVVL